MLSQLPLSTRVICQAIRFKVEAKARRWIEEIRQARCIVQMCAREGGALRAARVAQVLASGRLTPACASKLAGRLQWGSSQVFGRAARVWMPALYAHSHGCVLLVSCHGLLLGAHTLRRRTSKVGENLRRSLEWWSIPGTGSHEARASLPLCGRTLGLPMLARSGSCP
jgi:hypothetical protein